MLAKCAVHHLYMGLVLALSGNHRKNPNEGSVATDRGVCWLNAQCATCTWGWYWR